MIFTEYSSNSSMESINTYDGLYNLCVCEHKDGSGVSAVLSRYSGNKEMYDVIVGELERQLNAFEKEFEEL